LEGSFAKLLFLWNFLLKNKFCEVLYLVLKNIKICNESSVGNFPLNL